MEGGLVVEVGWLAPSEGRHGVDAQWHGGHHVDRIHPAALGPIRDHTLEAGLLGSDVAHGDVECVVVGRNSVQSGVEHHLVDPLLGRDREHLP